jgi:arylsulfatase A
MIVLVAEKSTFRSLTFVVYAVIVTAGALPVPAQHRGSRPNFVIIMADDMGFSTASVYDGWIKTPALERMARDGMKFTDFHSSGVVCSPTRAYTAESPSCHRGRTPV